MDKLKQVQKYQFWILLTVALILPVVGWVMASSGLQAEAATRRKKLDDLVGSLKTDGSDPNKDWEQGLSAINQVQMGQRDLAWRALWEQQQELMVWPERITSDPAKMELRDQERYRVVYSKEVEKVRQIVKPIDDEGQGLVEYPESLMPAADEAWKSQGLPPTIPQMEAAQEDLWLLTALLQAIAEVNEGANSQLDAAIKEIVALYLRGGSASKGGSGGATKSSGTGVSSQQAKMTEAMGSLAGSISARMGSSGGMGMMGGGMGGGSTINDYKFNPDDELGAEVAESSSSGTKSSTSSAAASSSGAKTAMSAAPIGTLSVSSEGMGGMGGMGGFGGGRGWSNTNKRYREEKDEWKTRGFYMELVIDQSRVPDLLVTLSNAKWPINVLRVQLADYKDEAMTSTDLASGMDAFRSPMPGAMKMGSPGMSLPPAMQNLRTAGVPAPRKKNRDADDEGDSYSSNPMASRNAGFSRNPQALDDPNLVNIALDGVIYVFKKPKEEPKTAPTAAPPTTTPAPTQAPVAASPAAGAPAGETVADTTQAESTEGDADKPAADAATADPDEKGPEPGDTSPPEPAGDAPTKKPATETKPEENAAPKPGG